MVLSLQSRAIHAQQRGDSPGARESEGKKQEACQFAGGRRNATILPQAIRQIAGIACLCLTDSAHIHGTRGVCSVLSAHQRSRKRCDDFKFITFSASTLPIK
jgi:hypothetical protein